MPAYLDQISRSIAAIDSYLAAPGDARRREVAQQILQSIRAVVIEYYGREEGLQVNANYMLAYLSGVATDDVKALLRFTGPDIAKFESILALKQYAVEEEAENFALPVPFKGAADAKNYLLPGAPSAFFHMRTEIVDDTMQIKRDAPNLSAKTIKELKEYFDSKGFESFASLNITYRGSKIGVVNVDSNRKCVFGGTAERKRSVATLLKPFCLLLGFVVYEP